jgi:hypothetical protein
MVMGIMEHISCQRNSAMGMEGRYREKEGFVEEFSTCIYVLARGLFSGGAAEQFIISYTT